MAMVAVFAVSLALLGLGLVVRHLNGPVTRARLERFARRQQLVITPENGEQVIAYLATTRRWRTAGLLVGGVGALLWSLPHGTLRISFIALFAGWFVGAVIAEWRVAALRSGAHRAASLQPRLLSDYLGPVTRALPVASAAACAAFAAAALAGSLLRHHGGPVGLVLVLVGAAGIGLALIAVVQRHVLMRPQPPAAADVLAADDAIRSRSLRVLAGSAVAAAGFPASSLAALLGVAYPQLGLERTATVALLLACVAALTGWRLAIMPSRVERAHPVTAAPAGGFSPQ